MRQNQSQYNDAPIHEPMRMLRLATKGGMWHDLDDEAKTSRNDSRNKVQQQKDRRKCRRLKQAS